MSEAIAAAGPVGQLDESRERLETRVNWRLVLLLGLLGLMLFALWYDYNVARLNVERSYKRVGELNARINAGGNFKVTTSADVRQTLGRTPSRVYVEGPFTVEAYGWMAGWPIGVRDLETSPTIGVRCHEYYAVYQGSGPNALFLKQFMFGIPADELQLSSPRSFEQIELADVHPLLIGPTGYVGPAAVPGEVGLAPDQALPDDARRPRPQGED